MSRFSRAVTVAAGTTWALALSWPLAGAADRRFSPEELAPGLHVGLLVLAAALTVSTLVPRLAASHLECFAMGMMSAEDTRDVEATHDANVVNLRPWVTPRR